MSTVLQGQKAVTGNPQASPRSARAGMGAAEATKAAREPPIRPPGAGVSD